MESDENVSMQISCSYQLHLFQFSQDDLLQSSRLLNKELKGLIAIFECYPEAIVHKTSNSSVDTSFLSGENHYHVKDRTLETVMLFAMEFGICPDLMERVHCINLIGKEIRRSQNDPDWIFPAGDILVSFSQV